MAYSSIHNMDTSLMYQIYLDGESLGRKVPAHHVDSVIDELELQGINIVDVMWDEENEDELCVWLESTSVLDGEDDYEYIV